MLRNATNLLTKWNARKNRKPLIVWGARQVGKTYLVKDIFAEEYYSNSYIYILILKLKMKYAIFVIIQLMQKK